MIKLASANKVRTRGVKNGRTRIIYDARLRLIPIGGVVSGNGNTTAKINNFSPRALFVGYVFP